jgi:nucleotide-binding universal stress UspA family protein
LVGIGRAAGVIVTWATQCGADLMVMATHGYGGFRRWALGSVADAVLRTTTMPLLLVRAQNRPA